MYILQIAWVSNNLGVFAEDFKRPTFLAIDSLWAALPFSSRTFRDSVVKAIAAHFPRIQSPA
jgi:hypothetical protein